MDMNDLGTLIVQYNEDDRAQRCLDIFSELPGQVNLSYVNSTEHIVAWHKHEKQTDYWFCVKGSFKVGIAYEEYAISFDGDMIDATGNVVRKGDAEKQWVVEWYYLSDKNQEVLKIPPGAYHGYKALEPNSILMYGLTHKYDPNDEFKVKPGHFNENWKTEDK